MWIYFASFFQIQLVICKHLFLIALISRFFFLTLILTHVLFAVYFSGSCSRSSSIARTARLELFMWCIFSIFLFSLFTKTARFFF
jgi:hypothetical protein